MSTDVQRRRRLAIFAGIVATAILAVAIVIALASGGGDSGTATKAGGGGGGAGAAGGLDGVKAVTAEFKGIPQTGNVLGDPNAPATFMVFADMQCPFCADFENQVMPSIVEDYVRPGKLKVVFQPIAILGNDSLLGAHAAGAAAQQDRMFEYVSILYRNQGQENTGYMDVDYLKQIGSATPGLDADKLIAALDSPGATKVVGDAQSLATSGNVNSTPSFFTAKKGGSLKPLQVTALDPEQFSGPLDKLTR